MDVHLRETFLELPTARLMPPSVNPALFGEGHNPFPYSMQDHTEEEMAPVQWRAVEIENEYLKLVVLPDMGGRVAEFYDKLAGRSIFMPIRQVKPAMLARRGAWVAGGLEFNFPDVHSPTTMDPVNCLTRRYQDGSASIVFGAIDRATFMNWKVELRLYPGMAYLEESVEICNPTDNFQRFGFWSVAAVPKLQGMRLAFPFDWRVAGDGSYEKWPMDGAVDSSDPSCIPRAYKTSGKLMVRDFFGAHYPDLDFGVAHSAARKKMKGAKLFTWGNGEDARAWNRTLMPQGGEYLEIESGLFESSSISRLMQPHGCLSFKEYWYGVRGIGMYSHATRDVAVAVDRSTGPIVLRFSANSRFDGAVVRLTHGGSQQECRISLTPESPVAVEFPGIGLDEQLAVDVICRGHLLASFGHEGESLPDAPDTSLFEDARTHHPEGEPDEQPLVRGMLHEQAGQLGEAADDYAEALGENPDNLAALVRLGRVQFSQHKPAEAIDSFEQVLRLDNTCGAARFGLAAAINGCGDPEQARRLFYDIAVGDPLFDASTLQAAELNIRLGDPYDNLTLLEDCACSYGRFLLEVSRRITGLAQELSEQPGALEEFFLAERFLGYGESAGLSAFTGNREDQLVCIALEYARLGRNEDCLAILTLAAEPGMKSALVKALCCHITLAEALSQPIGAVFVNEPMLLDMLESADDGTGKAQWLCGCFKYSAGLRAEALECWLAAYAQGLRHTALLFSLGQACLLDGDTEDACRYLLEDASLHSSQNAESLALLCRALKGRGDVFQRLELLPLLQETTNRSMVLCEIVDALNDGELFEEALALMESAQFQFRSGKSPSMLWSRTVAAFALKLARLGQADAGRAMAARAFVYPDGLNDGHRPDQSRAQYRLVLGQAWRLTGDLDRARESFRLGAQEGGIAAVRADDEAMRWVRLCQDELRY